MMTLMLFFSHFRVFGMMLLVLCVCGMRQLWDRCRVLLRMLSSLLLRSAFAFASVSHFPLIFLLLSLLSVNLVFATAYCEIMQKSVSTVFHCVRACWCANASCICWYLHDGNVYRIYILSAWWKLKKLNGFPTLPSIAPVSSILSVSLSLSTLWI